MSTKAPSPHRYRLAEGSFLGSFRILSPLAADADGETYLAKSSRRLTTFLIRVFPESATTDVEVCGQLEQRCELAGAIHHPGVARCSSLESEREVRYIAIELPDGPRGEPITLRAALNQSQEGLPEERVARLVEHLCDSLRFCHEFRRTGLPHGRLSLSRIYLTAQRQPRLADFALLHPGTDTQDIQALGRVTAELLTGNQTRPGEMPSTAGLSRFWSRFIARCLAAGTPEGYQNAGEIKETLEKRTESGHSGLRMMATAALLVVVIGGLAGLLGLQRRQSPPSSNIDAPRTATAADVPVAAGNQALDALRQRADDAVAAGDLDAARRAYESLLDLKPDDHQAKRKLDDTVMKLRLAAVNDIKRRAEPLFEQARQLQTGDGFDERIEALTAIRDRAGKTMASMDFETAIAQYRQLETAAAKLIALDTQRTEALRIRQQAESALETANAADAASDAASTYARGRQHLARAREFWSTQRFDAAGREFQQANRALMEAAVQAGGNRDVAAAKAAFEDVKQAADPTLMTRLPRDIREHVGTLDTTASKAFAAKDYTGAATHWREAASLLAKGLDDAAADGGGTLPALERFRRPVSGNLAVNGDFERGMAGQPEAWSPVDGLTTFWEKSGHPGFCIRFDTNVQQKDKQLHQANPEAFGGKTSGNQYGTVGAHEGVWVFSPPIPIKKSDRTFILEADCMGPAKSTVLFYPQVLIRGYQAFDPDRDRGTFSWFQTPHRGGPAYSEQFGKAQRRARVGDYLLVWRHAMPCRNRAADIWEHYEMAVELPQEARFRPEVILLKAYAMWPLGDYRFDNIVFREATREEFEKVKAKGHSIEGFMPTE